MATQELALTRSPPLLLLVGSLALVGCFGGGGPITGATLTCDHYRDTDVRGYHYVVESVSCAGESIQPHREEFNVDLVEGLFSAPIGTLATVAAEDSELAAFELFLRVPAGCYRVVAVAAASVNVGNPADWTPSSDCSGADTGVFEVVEGQTTDTAPMLSQCVGDPSGRFDATVVTNTPPVVRVEIDEKHNYECEAVGACVTAHDPDDDPLSFVFARSSGATLFYLDQGTPAAVGYEDGHRVWEQCATVVTQFTGSHDVTVTVRDHTPTGTTFEEEIGEESRDELTFPIVTQWIEDLLCFDSHGTLVAAPGSSIDRWPGCSWTEAETYYCSGGFGIDPAVVAFLCDGTDLIEENLYPDCGSR